MKKKKKKRMKRKGMGQVCCIGHTDSRSEQLLLQKFFITTLANKVKVFISTLNTLVQCQDHYVL